MENVIKSIKETQFSSGNKQLFVSHIVSRFATPKKAQEYSVGRATDRREKKCICKALQHISSGSSVLDLPCGNGRFLPLLKELGYNVTAADSSKYMVEKAQQYNKSNKSDAKETSKFHICNVLQTNFKENSFDAVICNRLFHHFSDADIRQQALKELRRICKGPIIVSFFCNIAYDALTFTIKNIVRRKTPNDRIPISPKTFNKDIQKAGLVAKKWLPMRPLISKQWYVVLERSS